PVRRQTAQCSRARSKAGRSGAVAGTAGKQRSLLRMGRPDRRRNRASQGAWDRCRTRTDAALRREGARDLRLFPRPGRLCNGVYELWKPEMTEAPGTHNPQFLPPSIPVPQDDGAARHLAGMKVPDLTLPATEGAAVNLSKLKGRTVVYIYPRTGV